MWGVFSTGGCLLGTFSDFASASLAKQTWPQAATVLYLGSVCVER